MNRPRLSVRVAGSPVSSFVIWIGCAALVFGWYGGHVRWWIGVAAIAAALRTRTAVKGMRIYNAWASEWQAMGREETPQPPQAMPKPSRARNQRKGWGLVAAAALLLLALVVGVLPATDRSQDGMMEALLILGLVLLAAALARAVLRSFRARARVTASKDERQNADNVVTWLVERPSSFPSRADAERELPDYCARLMADTAATHQAKILD